MLCYHGNRLKGFINNTCLYPWSKVVVLVSPCLIEGLENLTCQLSVDLFLPPRSNCFFVFLIPECCKIYPPPNKKSARGFLLSFLRWLLNRLPPSPMNGSKRYIHIYFLHVRVVCPIPPSCPLCRNLIWKCPIAFI